MQRLPKNKIWYGIHKRKSGKSKIELPYYSVGGYKNICLYCGRDDPLLAGEGSGENYPKCKHCSGEHDVKRLKRHTISSKELKGAKKQRKIC